MKFSFVALAAALIACVSAAPAPQLETRNVFDGKATWYAADKSEGNCGWWSSNADHIVALNTDQYGSTDKKSEHCGRLIRIVNENNKKVIHAVVADSCPTCEPNSLDLSQGLFSALADGDMDLGIFPISWSFLT